MKSTLGPTKESRPSMASEKELVVRAQTGDGNAFAELVRGHAAKVYGLARYLCGGHTEDAEETYQNALLKAYRNLATFRGEAQFSSWLTRIAINECLMHHRRQRRERDWIRLDAEPREEPATPVELADACADPEEEYAREEFWVILQGCLAELPESYRMPLLLRDFEGLPNSAIAARLGLSVPATKSRVMRARLFLQDCLSKNFCRDEKCYWPGPGLGFGPRIGRKRRERSCSLSR